MDTTDSVSRHRAPNATSAARAASAAAIVSVRGKSRRVAAAAAAATVIVGSTMAALTPISVADTPDARGKSPRTVQVSGQLVPADLDAGTYSVTGELIGTWPFPPDQTETRQVVDPAPPEGHGVLRGLRESQRQQEVRSIRTKRPLAERLHLLDVLRR